MSRAIEFGNVYGNGRYPEMNRTYRFRIVLDTKTSLFRPYILVFRGYKSDSACGWSHKYPYRTISPLYIPWHIGWRFRRFGLLRIVRIQGRMWRRFIG